LPEPVTPSSTVTLEPAASTRSTRRFAARAWAGDSAGPSLRQSGVSTRGSTGAARCSTARPAAISPRTTPAPTPACRAVSAIVSAGLSRRISSTRRRAGVSFFDGGLGERRDPLLGDHANPARRGRQ
jgi:hypothetical protein